MPTRSKASRRPPALVSTSVASAALLALLGGATSAQEPSRHSRGFYVGGTYGTVSTDLTGPDLPDVVVFLENELGLVGFTGTTTITANRVDESDRGSKLFGGYSLLPYLAIEGSLADLTAAKQTVNASVDLTSGINSLSGQGNASAAYDILGFGVSAVGRFPIGERFTVFGKAGVLAYEATADYAYDFEGRIGVAGVLNGAGLPVTAANRVEDDDTDAGPMYGIGAQYAFDNGITLRAEWERHEIDAFEAEMDVDLASLSVQYGFGPRAAPGRRTAQRDE